MPVDDAFARHDMAILYDSFNGDGPDREFYLRLVDKPCRILDLGCGTGSLTLALARRGHAVTGLDPASGMLAVARAKDTDGMVEWISGNAVDFRLGREFDLIIMTGHVFQVFLDDAEVGAVLAAARKHLAPDGRLVFESRNPLVREWEQWTEELTRERAVIPCLGPVEVYYQVQHVDAEHVTFDTVFTLTETAEQRTGASTLRFPSRDTIARLLDEAGFHTVHWYGDWDRSPFAPQSPEIIAAASR
ncbi:bifunctional 2-polyprenyl-6-hydroxyphenol methylase/3-demethylubiquinol 3-O-methyltransferase UbiG [Ciceribacter sp. RN22]|uniref:class I SAM-dependent methyltransferase n=1 Tax=Ciceribacter sp. RN22 TaxID=2954932 RepID=UPI0020926CAB|nr:class I SAM-dependent methyltransferase [Ciceribacter sp. RN22]MCO6176763.1 class I SAM-dependent methyltransferase [Ciceribacter sp. RN22]